MEQRSLTVGARLKKLREKFFDGSIRELSEKMSGRYSPSSISRRENGALKINEKYILAFCEAAGVPDFEKYALLASVNLSAPEVAGSRDKNALAFLDLIKNAKAIANHSLTIPVYLQTIDYTRKILENYHQEKSIGGFALQRRMSVDTLLSVQSERRIRLTFPESALYIPIGSPSLMAAQMRKLLNVPLGERFEFRILPASTFVGVPVHYFFTLIDEQFALSENRIRSVTENDLEKISRLARDFEIIWKAAASGEALRAIIHKAHAYYKALENTQGK